MTDLNLSTLGGWFCHPGGMAPYWHLRSPLWDLNSWHRTSGIKLCLNQVSVSEVLKVKSADFFENGLSQVFYLRLPAPHHSVRFWDTFCNCHSILAPDWNLIWMLTSTAIRKADLLRTHHRTHLKLKYKYFSLPWVGISALSYMTCKLNALKHVISCWVSKTAPLGGGERQA